MMKYTPEEIIANSEAAEANRSFNFPFPPGPDGKYSTDEYATLGLAPITCRKILAEVVIQQFDKPEDLVIIADDTPNGKLIGTKSVLHKKYEREFLLVMKHTKEVYAEAGFAIGDPNNDKFIPFDVMNVCQMEIQRRVRSELEWSPGS